MRKLFVFLGLIAFSCPVSARITSLITFPDGTGGEVQYNENGFFGGDSDFTFSTTTNRLTVSSASITYIIFSTANLVHQIRWSDGTIQTSSPTAGGGGGGGSIRVEDGGSPIVTTSTINFTGADFSVTNDSSEALIANTGATDFTISDELTVQSTATIASISISTDATQRGWMIQNDSDGDLWITANAYYDGENWYRVDTASNAWGIELITGGVFPGESDQGLAFWRASPAANPINPTFGTVGGWEIGLDITSNRDVVVGGNSVEMDGNGVLPYGRMLHARVGTSTHTGIAQNTYGDFSGEDDASYPEWFFGIKDDHFVIKRATNSSDDFEDWFTVDATSGVFNGLLYAKDDLYVADRLYMTDGRSIYWGTVTETILNGIDGTSGYFNFRPGGLGLNDSLYIKRSGTDLIAEIRGLLQLNDADNSHSVTLKSSDTVVADLVFTLPAADGTVGQALVTDGNEALYFKTISGGGSGTTIEVEDGGVSTVNTSTLNFTGDQFVVTDDSGEALVALDASSVTMVGPTVDADEIQAGSLGASVIASSIAVDAVGIDQLSATGTPDGTTYLRGDNTWSTVSASGGDDLGNHIATQTLDMGGFQITEVASITMVSNEYPVIYSTWTQFSIQLTNTSDNDFQLNESSAQLNGLEISTLGQEIDISDESNLAVSAPITLTDDTVGIDKSSATLLGPTIEESEISDLSHTSPGGSDTQIQYNDGGSFGGDADFVWDDSNNYLGISTDSPQAFIHMIPPGTGDVNIMRIDRPGIPNLGRSMFVRYGGPLGSLTLGGASFGWGGINNANGSQFAINDSSDENVMLAGTSTSGNWKDILFFSSVTIRDGYQVRLGDADSSNYVNLRASATVASDVDLVMPPDDGDSGEAMITDGSGVLRFDNLSTANIDPQAAWRVFISSGDSTLQEIALGADGTYLKSNGASTSPSWATPSGGVSGSVMAYRTTDLSVTASSDTILVCNTERHDIDGEYNTTTGVFWAGSDGVYIVSAYAYWNGVDSGKSYMLRLYHNGTETTRDQTTINATGSYTSKLPLTAVNVSAGDSIVIKAFHTATGTESILGAAADALTGISITRVQ